MAAASGPLLVRLLTSWSGAVLEGSRFDERLHQRRVTTASSVDEHGFPMSR